MVPTMERPQMVNMNNSGEPKLRTITFIIGIEPNSTRAPMMPPIMETMKAALSARLASPFCAMG